MRERIAEREQRSRGNKKTIRSVILAIAWIIGLVAALITIYEFVSGNVTLPQVFASKSSASATPDPTFPLHVLAPGAECDHGWSSAYWSNRFGTANCLTTYTRLTSATASCSGEGCQGVGSLEFALAAANLKLPARYTMTIVATFMVEGQQPVAGTQIFFVLQDFLPATPYGAEYAIVLSANGSYDVVKANCTPVSSGCQITGDMGGGTLDVTKSHTFGYQYDGKTTYAVMDGVKIDMKSPRPPAAFKYAQIAVISPDQHTPVSANFSDFRIQTD